MISMFILVVGCQMLIKVSVCDGQESVTFASREHGEYVIDTNYLVLREIQALKKEILQDRDQNGQLKVHTAEILASLMAIVNKIETINTSEMMQKATDEMETYMRKSLEYKQTVEPQHAINRNIPTTSYPQDPSLANGILHQVTLQLEGFRLETKFPTHIDGVVGLVHHIYYSGYTIYNITFVNTDGQFISTTAIPTSIKKIIHLEQDLYVAITDDELFKLRLDPRNGQMQVIATVSTSKYLTLFDHGTNYFGAFRVVSSSSKIVELFSKNTLISAKNITLKVNRYIPKGTSMIIYRQNSYIYASTQSPFMIMFDNLGNEMTKLYPSCKPVSLLNDGDGSIVVVCNDSIQKLDLAHMTWQGTYKVQNYYGWGNAVRMGDKFVISSNDLVRIFSIQ